MKKEAKKQVPEKKEVGFITVINTILGIILLLLGVVLFIISLYIMATALVIFGIFLLLPQKILRFSKWLKLIIVVVGFLVILAIQGMSVPSSPPEVTYYSLNEPFLLAYNNLNFSMII